MSYSSLTEITRNPRSTRGSIEKNWFMFGSEKLGSYVHYDMGPEKRSFAKLLGSGITTVNLTDPYEIPCIDTSDVSEGSWHQGTNSLMLILCNRADLNCKPTPQNQVFFAIIHHKHKNMWSLPLRYERYVMVWSAEPPFNMLGISKHPMLLYNETASGFYPEENWEDDPEQTELLAKGKRGKENWAVFTYTVSIAWAWGRSMDQAHEKNVGYLDDEVILGIGVDDKDMVYSRVLAKDLLQCLQSCSGRGKEPLSSESDVAMGDLMVHGFRASDFEEAKRRKKAEQEEKEAGEQDEEDVVEEGSSKTKHKASATRTPTIDDIADEAKSAVAAMRTLDMEPEIEEVITEEIVEVPADEE